MQISANDSQLVSTATTTVTVNAANSVVVLAPALAGPDPTGAQQTMTATVTQDGAAVAGAIVQFVVTGVNGTNGNGTTNSSGVATFVYAGARQGTDSVQATYGGIASNTATITWITPVQIISTTTVFGRFFQGDVNQSSFTAVPATPTLFSQEFPTIDFNPPAGTIPGNTSGVGVSTHPFTDVTTDVHGNFTGTIVAEGEGWQAGAGPLGSFQAAFTGSFTVASAGNVSINIFSDDGFILGIDGGATHVSGQMVNVPPSGTTPFENFSVVGAYNSPTAPAGNVEVVNFPAPGTYHYELDYFECCSGQLSLTMAIGSTGSTGTAPTGSLSITPINPSPINTGAIETLTVQATDASGAPVPNIGIFGIANGANRVQFSATTNSLGQATLQYSGANGGTDTVQAIANISGMSAFSNVVNVPWVLVGGGGGSNFVPQGWIGSPLIGAIIQGQVPITVASGVTLSSGVLEYWPTSNPSAVTILNSNTTGNGTLAIFDATLLPSGGYTIQLTATSSTGASQVSVVAVVVTGQDKPGRVTETITDFKVPLAGIPISITRTYDSLTRGTVGDFGNGWSLATTVNLTIDAFNNVTFTFNQQNITFNFVPQATSGLFPWLLSPVYAPAPGFHGTLTSDGCNALVQVQSNVVCFPSTSAYQPTTFTYTDPAGRVYTIAATGQLKLIKDLNGNTVTFTPSGISSSVGGVAVPFLRDGQGRITQITDLNQNNYTYTYDSPCGSGNLCSVTFPGISTPALYTYASDHSMLTKTDPNGSRTTRVYYPPTDPYAGRLKSITTPAVSDANGNPIQYVTQYAYNICFSCGLFGNENIIQTTVTNPDNGKIVTNYDTFGKPLNITDPLGNKTQYTYDSNENLQTMIDPLNNPPTQYTWDANGFKTSIQDPLGHTTTWINNQFGEVTSTTDAANTNTVTSTYDPVTFQLNR